MDKQKIEAIIQYVDVMPYEPQVRRVLEIGLLGKFSICFAGSKDGTGMNWGKIANELDLVSYFLVPCPCGYLADPRQACKCTTSQIQAYYQTSFAMTARAADLHIEIPNLKVSRNLEESFSESIRRVQSATFKTLDLNAEARKFLDIVVKNLELSEIRQEKTKQIACVIACLDQCAVIEAHHIAEAIQYRPKELFDFLV